MLKFVKVTDSGQVEEILKNSYDPKLDTWIVSDLRSKQEIQKIAIDQYGYFTDDAIMRISDFWRLWIRRLAPKLNVVSGDFIQALVQNFADREGESLGISESEVSGLNRAVQEFAPILLHPASSEIVEDWLEEQFQLRKKNKNWQTWFDLSKRCLDFILNEKNAIDSRWSAAFLQSTDLNYFSWPRRIFLDLGSELSTLEMGLFKVLSQKHDVSIITPDPKFSDKFSFLLSAYNENLGYGEVLNAQARNNSNNILRPEQFLCFSTQLSEIKFAVSQCRRWLEAGVNSEHISIIAADIEAYWPVLKFHLEEEGILFKKDSVTYLNSLGDIQSFLALLQNFSKDVSWESLEKTLFSKDQVLQISFEKFKGLFYQLYDQDDLTRDKKISDLFYRKTDYSADVDRDEFLSFLVRIWGGDSRLKANSELFELLMRDVLSQSINVKFKLKNWVSFLKNRLRKKEITLKKSGADGISVLPLMSAQLVEKDYRLYIGMNDEYFSTKNRSMINAEDAATLRKNFDLWIDSGEENNLDFNLRWQSQSLGPNCYFSGARIGFGGQPLNLNLFFLENNPHPETAKPGETRIDQLQAFLSDGTSAKVEQYLPEVSTKRLSQDRNGLDVKIKSDAFRRLSVSDIENYGKCGFKLLASKGFGLRDYSQVGIELDPREKGSLVHSLFEFLIHKVKNSGFNENEVIEFLDKERLEKSLYVNLDHIWQVQRTKFLIVAKKFFDFEKQRRSFSEVETEKKLKIYFDSLKKTFSLNEPQSGFELNLRVDRIDKSADGRYRIVYDYKSSPNPDHKVGKWIEGLQFQMLIYMTALQLEFEDAETVKGLMYYYYKNFKIDTGLIDRSIGIDMLALSSRNSSLKDEEEVKSLYEKFLLKIVDLLIQLESGVFRNKPYKNEICADCDWNKICRAEHLM